MTGSRTALAASKAPSSLGAGNDSLQGDSGANLLSRRGGADSLVGGASADRLIAGAGADNLAGGLGNDVFVFQGLADLGVSILDFGNVVGDNDRFEIARSDLGGGLVAGVVAATLFRNLFDNFAQDANDRLGFRCTDASLWYDANGNGVLTPVLIVDLKPVAVVFANDITLV